MPGPRHEELFLPVPVVSWNKIATSHWRVYKNLKDEQSQVMWYVLRELKLKPFKTPVRITVTAHWKDNRQRDVDNIFWKAALDTLKKAGVVQDDSIRFVESITLKGKLDCEEEGIEIVIQEV